MIELYWNLILTKHKGMFINNNKKTLENTKVTTRTQRREKDNEPMSIGKNGSDRSETHKQVTT